MDTTTITLKIADKEGNVSQSKRIHSYENEWWDGSIGAQCQQFKEFLSAQGFSESIINKYIKLEDEHE